MFLMILTYILVYLIARKNGFSLEEDPHALIGQRFKLKAVPFSKNITFGVEGNKGYLILFIREFLAVFWFLFVLHKQI